MLVTVTTLYFTHVEHITAATVGLILSLAGVVGIAVVTLSGRLVRIVGQRRALAIAYSMTASCYCGYLFIHGTLGLLILVMLGEGGFLLAQPIRIVLARSLAADHAEGLQVVAVMGTIRNVAYGVKGIITTAVLAQASPEAYRILLVGSAAALVIAAAMIAHGRSAAIATSETVRLGALLRELYQKHRQYLALTALNGAVFLYDSILSIGVPLWVVRDTNAPAAVVGILFTMNTVGVIALQIRITRLARSTRGAGRAYGRAGLAILTGCILFAFAGSSSTIVATVLILAGAIVTTGGELLSSAAQWGASLALAPAKRRDDFLGIFNASVAAEYAIGPALVTLAITGWGVTGWVLLGAVAAIAGLAAEFVLHRPRSHIVNEHDGVRPE
jgi:hypothetical protein